MLVKAKSLLLSYNRAQRAFALSTVIISAFSFAVLLAWYYRLGAVPVSSMGVPQFLMALSCASLAPAVFLKLATSQLEREDFGQARHNLLMALLLSVVALGAQVYLCLYLQNLAFDGGRFAGILVFLAACLVTLHMLPGVLLLGHLVNHAARQTTYVNNWVFWQNPYRHRLLNTTYGYWLMLGGLWVYLFVLFF